MATSDNDITRLLSTNPPAGFNLLVRKYSEAIYRHIRRLVVSHHDAEDATQETFLRIYRSIGTLQETAALKCWIYRIATNEALRLISQRNRPTLAIDETMTNTLAADEYINWADVEAVTLKRAILSLPPKQQATFNLRYYDELDYHEIAAILSSTPESAKANFHHAKERIIKFMDSIY